MRLVVLNANGVRRLGRHSSLAAHHSWRAKAVEMGATFGLCIQETKIDRAKLTAEKELCAPEGLSSFYELSESGYQHGVVTMLSDAACRPIAAEGGLTGARVPAHAKGTIGLRADSKAGSAEYDALDASGRVMSVDVGPFVLVNVYAPYGGPNGSKADAQ